MSGGLELPTDYLILIIQYWNCRANQEPLLKNQKLLNFIQLASKLILFHLLSCVWYLPFFLSWCSLSFIVSSVLLLIFYFVFLNYWVSRFQVAISTWAWNLWVFQNRWQILKVIYCLWFPIDVRSLKTVCWKLEAINMSK